jgi:hypothetical protein
MLFESQPVLFVLTVVAIVEAWLRLRRPIIAALKRLVVRRTGLG